MHHYTDRTGYNGIRRAKDWLFRAGRPPGDHPFGAYFTTLGPATKNLAMRLRIPNRKIEYVLAFTDSGNLLRLRGQRGDFILYSPGDYEVPAARQVVSGERAAVGAGLNGAGG